VAFTREASTCCSSGGVPPPPFQDLILSDRLGPLSEGTLVAELDWGFATLPRLIRSVWTSKMEKIFLLGKIALPGARGGWLIDHRSPQFAECSILLAVVRRCARSGEQVPAVRFSGCARVLSVQISRPLRRCRIRWRDFLVCIVFCVLGVRRWIYCIRRRADSRAPDVKPAKTKTLLGGLAQVTRSNRVITRTHPITGCCAG